MTQERIELAILGQNINSIRLDELNKILSSYQNILDRSYLAYQNKDRMTKSERDNFYASCQAWRQQRSIYIDFLIVAPAFAQLVLSYSPLMHVNPISVLMENILKFFKVKKESGENSQIIINSTTVGKDITNIKIAGNKIYVHPTLAKASDKARPDFHNLASCMRKSKIERIASYAQPDKERGFSMTREDAEVLFPETRHDDIPQKMNVKIYQFNANSGKGMLSIIDSSYPDDLSKIKFDVDKKEVSYNKIIEAMPDSIRHSTVMVTKDIRCHPSGEENIIRLHINNIK